MPTVVIIGAGLAGLRTASEFRAQAYPGRVLLIGAESHPPYDRPPLSSHLLSKPEPVWLAEDLSIEWPGTADEIRLGTAVTGLAVGSPNIIVTSTGERIEANDVVIATGATPVNPWPATATLSTLDDAAAIRAATAAGPIRVTIIGAGWIGTELAGTLAAAGHHVTLIEASEHPLAAQLGAAAEHTRALLTGWARPAATGVSPSTAMEIDLRTGVRVLDVHLPSAGSPEFVVVTDGGAGGAAEDPAAHIGADLVITAVGVRPATDWLEGSGVERAHSGAIPVDDGGRVAVTGVERPRVWAVGDVATTLHPHFGQVVGGHWFGALRNPESVAANIVASHRDAGDATGAPGGGVPAAPEVFSDHREHHLEVIGSLTGEELILRGNPGTGPWTLLHLKAGRLVGAVVFNSPRDTSAIRKALSLATLPEVDAAQLADSERPLRGLLPRR